MPIPGPIRVLAIDDDEVVCRRISGALVTAGFDVVTFTDPTAGLAFVKEAGCDVALVDLLLPEADSSDVIAEVLRRAPRTIVVALAAMPEPHRIIAAMRAGACDLVEKPIQSPALLHAIERQLARNGRLVADERALADWVAHRVRALRQEAALTQAQIAERSGMSVAQLSSVESGHSLPTLWTLARVCDALRIPLSRLFEQ